MPYVISCIAYTYYAADVCICTCRVRLLLILGAYVALHATLIALSVVCICSMYAYIPVHACYSMECYLHDSCIDSYYICSKNSILSFAANCNSSVGYGIRSCDLHVACVVRYPVQHSTYTICIYSVRIYSFDIYPSCTF